MNFIIKYIPKYKKMSKKSIILHWHYLKKDTVGEINFCVTKFINIIYEAITTLLSRFKLSFWGGKDWLWLKGTWHFESLSFSV